MLTKRIIACLDVDAGRVVKGTRFLGLRDAGDPAELARAHAHSGADEVVLLDIGATHEQRGILIETVRPERIVTAMVVWSQLGIIGYLLGPLAGGGLTQSAGFAALGLAPLAAALLLLALIAAPSRGQRGGPLT